MFWNPCTKIFAIESKYYGSTAKSFTQGFQNTKICYFTNFLRIDIEFQSSLLEITKRSLKHYSNESWAMQITPWGFAPSTPRSLARFGKGNREGSAGSRRRVSPAARRRGPGSYRGPRRTSRWLRDGSGWPMAAGPRAPAGGGGRRWRRRRSDEA